ncbi:polyprotein, partial [Bienertia sinuspersici]
MSETPADSICRILPSIMIILTSSAMTIPVHIILTFNCSMAVTMSIGVVLFTFINSADELWEEIRARNGKSNAPLLFDIHKNLTLIQQGELSITEYYNKLKRVWDELCKLIKFLVGLNPSYDQVKINLLSMDPLPNVLRAYHILQQVEKQNFISSSSQLPEVGTLFHPKAILLPRFLLEELEEISNG